MDKHQTAGSLILLDRQLSQPLAHEIPRRLLAAGDGRYLKEGLDLGKGIGKRRLLGVSGKGRGNKREKGENQGEARRVVDHGVGALF